MNLKPTKWKVMFTIVSLPIFFYISLKLGTILNIIKTETLCQSSINGSCGVFYTNGYIAIIPAILFSIIFYIIYSYNDKK